MALGLHRLARTSLSVLAALVELAAAPACHTGTNPSPELANVAFLTLVPDSGLVAHDVDGKVVRRLVDGAFNTAMLDPRFELCWLRRDDRLEVYDLRAPSAAPRTVATGIPPEVILSVSRPVADADDVLEQPSVCEPQRELMLEWTDNPRIVDLTDGGLEAAGTRIVDGAWLRRERTRPVLPVVPRVDFVSPASSRVRLPWRLGRCDEPDDCGLAIPFGSADWRLVMIESREGADCKHTRCLGTDANGRFATPPELATWKVPPDVPRTGPCGPYRFDQTGSHYLIGDKLCIADRGCRRLEGNVLGWLKPGPVVGTDG